LLLFGANKLPELSKSIGESIRELRKGFKDEPNKATDEKVASKDSENKDGHS
jgi:TatA/E family protein of Tat protein translocase